MDVKKKNFYVRLKRFRKQKQFKKVIESGINSLVDSAQQNADSAEITTENVEEFSQIVDECNKATETVVIINKTETFLKQFVNNQ